MEADRPWDEVSARRLVTSVATVDIRLFAGFADVDRDDLVQIGLTAAQSAILRTWNPAAGSSWANFVAGVAHRRNLDELKRCVRRRAREHRFAQMRPEAVGPPELHFAEWDKDVPLHEWLQGVYTAAKRVYTSARWRRGRRYYNVAQLIAIATLKYRLGPTVSFRSLHQMLVDDKRLRVACHLRTTPSYNSIHRAMAHLAEFRRATIDPVMGVPDPRLQGLAEVATKNAAECVGGE